jgi:hypothetical protein
MADAANDRIVQLLISCEGGTHETMAASAFGEVAEEVSPHVGLHARRAAAQQVINGLARPTEDKRA